MKVHSDDMTDACNGEEIRHETSGNGASMRLLLGLTGVRKVSAVVRFDAEESPVTYGITAAAVSEVLLKSMKTYQ